MKVTKIRKHNRFKTHSLTVEAKLDFEVVSNHGSVDFDEVRIRTFELCAYHCWSGVVSKVESWDSDLSYDGYFFVHFKILDFTGREIGSFCISQGTEKTESDSEGSENVEPPKTHFLGGNNGLGAYCE